MKKFLDKLLPRYAYLAIFAVIAVNLIAYFGSKLFISNATWHSLAISGIDDKIPFVPQFIIIYVLSFVQWGAGFVLTARESKRFCYSIFSAEMIEKIICAICFIVFPTAIVRPDVSGGGFWNFAVRFVYFFDTPAVNLFPSIHVAESWLCVRCAFKYTKVPKWYAALNAVFTVFVCASIVLVKQHFFIDIFGGIAVCELSLLLSKVFKGYRALDFIESKLLKQGDK